jgi:diguanylate cyclase (GGDEF)-like protein
MELIIQLWITGFAAALFLCLAVQLPRVTSLRWWLFAAGAGFLDSLLEWFCAGQPSARVGTILLLCVCVKIWCIARGLFGQVRLKYLWVAFTGSILLGFVLFTLPFDHSPESVSAAHGVIASCILVMLGVHLWNQRNRQKGWASFVIPAILLMGVARELLGVAITLHWLALSTDQVSSLIFITWEVIGSCGSMIALFFISIDAIATRAQELHAGSERMRKLLDFTDHGICEVNERGLITYVNSTAAEMLAIGDRNPSQVWIQEKLEANKDDISIQAVSDFMLRPGMPVRQAKAHIARSTRPPIPVEWSSSPILRDGKPAGSALTLHDITEREAADRFIRVRTELLEMIARNKPVEEVSKLLIAAVEERMPGYYCSILVCDIECLHVIASTQLPEGFRSAMNTVPCSRMFQVTDRKGSIELKNWEDALRAIARDYNFGGTWTEPMVSHANELLGTVVLNRSVMAPLEPPQSRILREAARLEALAIEHRGAYERLLHQGYHDALTGLPNRLLLADRLKQALARAERTKAHVAFLSIDLDRFKDINDTLGHDAGDLFLQQFGARLGSRVRASDTLARTGGDEFTLVLPDMHDLHDVSKVAESLVTALRDPFQVENHTIYGTASIGVAVYPQDGMDADSLQRNADRAMYRAKAQGRNLIQCYSGEDSSEARSRIEMEIHLRRAIELGNFSLHFQPQFTCERRLAGFEALLRFQHPKLGPVPPSRFIPMAEESGLILPIGEWVLHEVCRQLVEWQEKGLRAIRVAINVSPLQLARGDFSETVARALRATGVKPELLELELTEGVLMSSVHDSAREISELARIGVRLSVDDFGTGYSCLSYLHQLPLHALKIDRSFVARMLEPEGTRCIVEAIIPLAHQLGLQTVAEGVENEDQLALLRTAGCDLIQGFFFSKPLSAIDASCLLWKDAMSEPESKPPASIHDRTHGVAVMGRRSRRTRL